MKKLMAFALLPCMTFTFAACSKTFEEDSDLDSDLTVYVKWDK